MCFSQTMRGGNLHFNGCAVCRKLMFNRKIYLNYLLSFSEKKQHLNYVILFFGKVLFKCKSILVPQHLFVHSLVSYLKSCKNCICLICRTCKSAESPSGEILAWEVLLGNSIYMGHIVLEGYFFQNLVFFLFLKA